MMARPQKMGDQKRDLTIRVRVTSAEKQRIWKLAAEAAVTPSDFLRLKAMGSEPLRQVPTPERESLLKGLAELGKVGSNVNQIAHTLNRYHSNGYLMGIHEEAMQTTLEALDELTAQLLTLLSHGHSR
ncbi:plasmid mobilization relaxosome protein MobC [Siphonobacter sp. SORGH_AS_1065]|uniref:plasmid mobilization protein n=1 Tax=Siphonobacter sp. SORGH_AS_1065 TaxID=3041795 RepID=UPI00277F41A2|nr:plasmid mobilization relaxosome protein MobC [Siphonobacter sp. SORGH_AS_1065]MDQ1086183.1 hypothetical protein [Siphonobacter sp. SORGH_AS_1065]